MEYTLYRIRWCFVGVLFFANFTVDFSSCAYGIVTNIVARYFNISPFSVDMLPSATFFVGSIVLVVMALFHNHIGVRAQCIILTIGGLFGAITVTIGFLHNDYYYFVLMGQIFIGISAGISFVTSVNMAANWFSENEVGTTIAIEFSAIHAGQMLSSLLYPLLLNDVLDNLNKKFDSDKVRNVFAISFGIISSFLLICVIFVCLYAKDHPPSPPSASQEKILNASNQKKAVMSMENILESLKKTASHYRNINFVLITIIVSLDTSYFAMTKVLITSLLMKTFPDIPESLPGTIRIVGNILAVFFSLAAGLLIDRFGRYKLFSSLPIAGLISSCISILFAHHYKCLKALTFLYPLTMGLRGFSEVTLVEYLTEVTYPAEKVTLMCAHYIPMLIFQSIFIAVERVLMETFNETIAIFVPLTVSVVSLPMLMAVTSVYHRSNANNSEKTTLLTKQTNKRCSLLNNNDNT
ncbi:choline/ethanolamine transporter FLVCR2-like [Styela clava]